jgi:cytoskeletal protein CcmA (bactofilin family)
MWKKEKPEANAGQVHNPMENPTPDTATDLEQEVIAFVGKGVTFKGSIMYEGTVRIDGRMDGEIQTDGVLIVGEEAVVTAKVTAGSIVSKGKMTGDFVALHKISLMSPAILDGSVKAPLLSIEEGVLFNGTCGMKKPEHSEKSREPVLRPVNGPPSTAKRVPVNAP